VQFRVVEKGKQVLEKAEGSEKLLSNRKTGVGGFSIRSIYVLIRLQCADLIMGVVRKKARNQV